MRVIEMQTDVPWMPAPNLVRLVLDAELPPVALTTSVFALGFDEERRLLMTRLTKRGWDLPGGHIESGESAEEALRREVLEETGCVLGVARLLGYQHLRLTRAEPPADYRYPFPESFQVFFVARVAAVREFASTAEAAERGFFEAAAAAELPWVRANRALYDAAVAEVISS